MHFSTGRSAWHTTNFCFDFSNTVQHAHVQPLTLSTASSKVEVTHQMNSQAVSIFFRPARTTLGHRLWLRSKYMQVGVNQTRNCVFRLAKTKAQQARLAMALQG